VLLVHPLGEVSWFGWAMILLSGLFETGYVFSLAAAYRAGELSLVYPLARGTAPLVVTPLAAAMFGDRPSASGLVAIVLVVTGIYASYARGLRSAGAPGSRRAAGLAVLTGVMTAGYSLVNSVGVRSVPVPLYGFLVFVVNVVLLCLVLRWRGLPILVAGRGPWIRTTAIGVLMMAAYLAVLLAMSQAPVSYVVAGREVSIVVGAVLGVVVLGERDVRARLAGAVLIFLGLVVLALSR
jgi:drug/metabolite transporter (DMT)-like permease